MQLHRLHRLKAGPVAIFLRSSTYNSHIQQVQDKCLKRLISVSQTFLSHHPLFTLDTSFSPPSLMKQTQDCLTTIVQQVTPRLPATMSQHYRPKKYQRLADSLLQSGVVPRNNRV